MCEKMKLDDKVFRHTWIIQKFIRMKISSFSKCTEQKMLRDHDSKTTIKSHFVL